MPSKTDYSKCHVEQNDCNVFKARDDIVPQIQFCGTKCIEVGWVQGHLPYLQVVFCLPPQLVLSVLGVFLSCSSVNQKLKTFYGMGYVFPFTFSSFYSGRYFLSPMTSQI